MLSSLALNLNNEYKQRAHMNIYVDIFSYFAMRLFPTSIPTLSALSTSQPNKRTAEHSHIHSARQNYEMDGWTDDDSCAKRRRLLYSPRLTHSPHSWHHGVMLHPRALPNALPCRREHFGFSSMPMQYMHILMLVLVHNFR